MSKKKSNPKTECNACNKKLVEGKCPSGKCEHTGHWHDYRYTGFFNSLFGDPSCVKCGDKSVLCGLGD